MATTESPTPEELAAASERKFQVKIERYLLDIQETEQNLADLLKQQKEVETEWKEAGSPIKRAQLSFTQNQLSEEVQAHKLILADLRADLHAAQQGLEALQKRKDVMPPLLSAINTYNRALTELVISVDEVISASDEAKKAGTDPKVLALLGTCAGYLNQRLDLLPRQLTRLEVDKAETIRAAHIHADNFQTGATKKGAKR